MLCDWREGLGDGDFVMEVLSEAEEKFERSYELKRRGYDLQGVARKVCEIFDVEPDDIYSGGRRKIQAEARRLFCYRAAREVGYSLA